MANIVEQGRLYDFYGGLLTDHQRAIFEQVVYQDLSLSEIAEEHGISRQGVSDLIRRCTRSMEAYEERLRMAARFEEILQEVARLEALAKNQRDTSLSGELLSIAGRLRRSVDEESGEYGI